MLKFQVSRVIARIAVVFTIQKAQDAVEVSVWLPLREETVGCDVVWTASGQRIARGGIGRRRPLADIDAVQKVRTFVPHIVGLEGRVPRQLTLDREVPLLNIRVMRVLGDDHSKELAPVCRRTDLMQWNWGKHLVGQLGKREIGRRSIVNADDERVDVAGVVNLAGFERIEEDTVAAANNCLTTQTIGKPNPWSERLVGTVRRIGAAAVPIKTVSGRRDRASQALYGRRSQSFVGIAQSALRISHVHPEHLVALLGGH